VIERLMIMVPGDVIGAVDLAFLDIAGIEARSAAPAPVGPLFEARDAWEREYILSALTSCDGNISRTAEALGIERSNLYKKMRGLGIAPRERDEQT
jgi:two-component system nitrogen regulation response regulator NtrX